MNDEVENYKKRPSERQLINGQITKTQIKISVSVL